RMTAETDENHDGVSRGTGRAECDGPRAAAGGPGACGALHQHRRRSSGGETRTVAAGGLTDVAGDGKSCRGVREINAGHVAVDRDGLARWTESRAALGWCYRISAVRQTSESVITIGIADGGLEVGGSQRHH